MQIADCGKKEASQPIRIPKSEIRNRMNPYDTALSIAHALATSPDPAMAAVHIYAHDSEVLPDGSVHNHVEEIFQPAALVEVRFDALAGSSSIGKARVQITVESQSDDDDAELHAAREKAVRALLADIPTLQAAFGHVGLVTLLGRPAMVDNDPNVKGRAFVTPMTWVMGIAECGL